MEFQFLVSSGILCIESRAQQCLRYYQNEKIHADVLIIT